MDSPDSRLVIILLRSPPVIFCLPQTCNAPLKLKTARPCVIDECEAKPYPSLERTEIQDDERKRARVLTSSVEDQQGFPSTDNRPMQPS